VQSLDYGLLLKEPDQKGPGGVPPRIPPPAIAAWTHVAPPHPVSAAGCAGSEQGTALQGRNRGALGPRAPGASGRSLHCGRGARSASSYSLLLVSFGSCKSRLGCPRQRLPRSSGPSLQRDLASAAARPAPRRPRLPSSGRRWGPAPGQRKGSRGRRGTLTKTSTLAERPHHQDLFRSNLLSR
jgi:hypothetical protein